MIQCKYCGATAQFPIDVSHRKDCIKIPEGAYLPELYQEIPPCDGVHRYTPGKSTYFSYFREGSYYHSPERRSGKDRRK